MGQLIGPYILNFHWPITDTGVVSVKKNSGRGDNYEWQIQMFPFEALNGGKEYRPLRKLTHDMYMISSSPRNRPKPGTHFTTKIPTVSIMKPDQTSKPQRKECCARAAYMNALRSATVDPTATP
jgi:hypothetical protein